MSKKIVVVGGVAGGATAVARLRRLNEDAKIILFEKGEYVSFANCGLPYYIGGVIKQRDALFVSDKASIESKYKIDIRNFSEVIKIDRENKSVLVREKDGNEYSESYDVLLLSTGSTPFVPNMEGKDNDNVFTLWNVPDTDRIYNYIKENKPKHAVVAGGGFIGLEMAENLHERGIKVTLVEFANQVMPPIDKDMAKIVENHIEDNDIKLMLNVGVDKIIDKGKTVVLTNGEKINTDMTLLSIGVRPNTGFVKEAGIEVNQRGGVIVDEYMQTSDPNIYAIGDMIEVVNKVSNLKTMIPLAGPANKQGRAVAANILGLKQEKYEGSIGTSVAKVFDMTVANTGENEKSLQARGLVYNKDYAYVLVHPSSHAGYYPGSTPMTLKLIFSLEDGRVLGGQIVGYDGVDKRIDTMATAIHFKGDVYDLTQLELAYAPPYSSAKDPVNMAGYMATNILEGLSDIISYQEYIDNKDDYVLIDVREKIENDNGKIEGSINIPLSEFRNKYFKLDKSKKYVVHCAVGIRGYIAERILKQAGYNVKNLLGGYRTYQDMNYVKGSSLFDIEVHQDKLPSSSSNEIDLDVCGLSCPGPIVSVSKTMEELNNGDIVNVKATDPGFIRDIESWCTNTGNVLLSKESSKGVYKAVIQKGVAEIKPTKNVRKEKTMIIFDGDLDKAIASFIIANGAVAMGNKVNMFFTFWGLSILRKSNPESVEKDMMSKMFSVMLPKGSKSLGLSKMNFGGLGAKMMRKVMKEKGVSSLEELIKDAMASGVRIVACQMSMDVMGITKEELIDGVEIGGVATMLNDSDNSNMNLFI